MIDQDRSAINTGGIMETCKERGEEFPVDLHGLKRRVLEGATPWSTGIRAAALLIPITGHIQSYSVKTCARATNENRIRKRADGSCSPDALGNGDFGFAGSHNDLQMQE